VLNFIKNSTSISKFAISIGLAATLCTALVWKQNEMVSDFDDKTEEADKKQLLEAYFQQEFEKLVDPAIGRVPQERLQSSLKTILRQEQRQQHLRTPVSTQLTWIERGPNNIGGRTRTLLFDKNDATQKKVWAGSVGGGIWFTNDITAAAPIWSRPTNADQLNNLVITTLAQHPTNPLIMYFGTGEGWYNFDGVQGGGIWKTADGGVTWMQLQNTIPGSGKNTAPHTHFIQKIVVTSDGTVLAATEGAAYCDMGGIYRSTDNGNSWTLIKMPTRGGMANCDNVGSTHTDIEIGANGTIYTSNGLFFSDGVYRSTDNGATWTKIFTSNAYEQRIEIAVAPNDDSYVYLMTQGLDAANIYAVGRILRSTNATSAAPTFTAQALPSWSDACSAPSNDFTRGQATYDLTLSVDPNDKNTVFAGGIDFMRSTNGGANWTQISEWWNCSSLADTHADQHSLTFAPNSSTTAYVTNDGGIYRLTNANGATPTFTALNMGYNVTQFYAVAINPTACSNNMLAGAQDNGTQQFMTESINTTTEVTGGDGAYCHIDRDNPNLQISSYIYNKYRITNNNWATYTSSNINSYGRFINPTEYDDVNNLLYTGHEDGSYGVLSGGLLSGVSGVSSMVKKTGLIGSVGALKIDPNNTNTLWIGSAAGTLHKITNPNGTPVITILPSATYFGGYISSIDVEKGNSNHILVTVSNYGVVSVRESMDGGATWANVEGDLPDIPVRWGLFNPLNADQVFLATELGVMSTIDLNGSNTNWVSNGIGLAKVRINMLKYRNSDYTLVAATHGRGLFTTNLAALSPMQTASVERNTESTQIYLGANAEVYCYSSTDGQIMARIKNLSAHDYGCTQVSVTRSSMQSLTPQPFTDNNPAHAILPKTWEIIPTNPNATGRYEITFYYTAAEVTAWESYTGKGWKNEGCISKCSGNILNVTPAAPTAGGSIETLLNMDAEDSNLPYMTATFSTGFGTFGIGGVMGAATGSGGVLPLNLLDFKGQVENKTALLTWTTAQMTGVLGFEIERSLETSNAQKFEKIGFVPVTNFPAIQYFNFKDDDLKKNIQYYRLKIKEIDATYHYSKIIALQIPELGGKAGFTIAPNPVQAEMQLIIHDLPAQDFQISIADMAGKVVLERNYPVGTDNRLLIPTEALLKGTYIVTLKTVNRPAQSVKMRKI
jgi:Secretion system C-terminal sorting domain